MGELRDTTVGELGTHYATGPFGSDVSSKNFQASGAPMLRGSNLSAEVGTRLDEHELVFLPEDALQRFSRSVAERGDLVFTCWGTVGQVGLVHSRTQYERYVVSNKQMLMRPDTAKVDPQYLYYNLSQQTMISLVVSQSIGSSVPGFNLGQLRALPVRIHDLPEQRAIAEVLGALDDKIAANTRLASTADELVRTLWCSLTKRAEATCDLGEITELVRSQVDPGGVADDLPYVGLEHIPRRCMWLAEVGEAGAVSSAKSRYASGDVLFGRLRPYFHKVSAAPVDGICSTDVLVLRAKSPELAGFVLAAAASDDVVARATASSEGTRMPRASWKDLAAIPVPWPGTDEAEAFSQDVTLIRLAVQGRLNENVKLAATRDALLPNLMAGNLCVRDAEQVASDLT